MAQHTSPCYVIFIRISWYKSVIIVFILILFIFDHLLCIDFQLNRGTHYLATDQYAKFIDFQSIIHRFQFEMIYPQEFALIWSPKGKIFKDFSISYTFHIT